MLFFARFCAFERKGTGMAKSSRPTAHKRAREKALQERQVQKQQRRAEARDRRAGTSRQPGDEDPDLAGMRPGPQPPPEWLEADSSPPEEDQEQ
jgi:hypothetical protein